MLSDEVYISLESLMYFGSVFPENTAGVTGAYTNPRRCMRPLDLSIRKWGAQAQPNSPVTCPFERRRTTDLGRPSAYE